MQRRRRYVTAPTDSPGGTARKLTRPQPARGLLSKSVLAGFDKAYEEPTPTEGFAEIKKVNFVFEGTDAERARWNMWLQVDGK